MAKQQRQWQELTATLDNGQIAEWLKDIEMWEKDPSSLNPYRPRTKGIVLFDFFFKRLDLILISDLTQADIRLELARQDAHDIRKSNMEVKSDLGPSAMISLGLELEESL